MHQSSQNSLWRSVRGPLGLGFGGFALLLALALAHCAAWVQIPADDRAVILGQTIRSGVAALAGRPLPEAASGGCITQAPALWPRAAFRLSFRPDAQLGLTQSGYALGHGPGELRVGASGCLEISTMVPGDPGNAWVPFKDDASQLVQANYFNRYGPKFWAGHFHGRDGEVCSPAQWINELDHPVPLVDCGSMPVIDTYYSNRFYELRARYYAAFPQTPPPLIVPAPTSTPIPPPVISTPTPTPPPVPPTTGPPVACPPEKVCEPCAPPAVCEVCRECPSPAVLVVPEDVLATLRAAPGTVEIPRGKRGPAARAWKAKLEAVLVWAESVNGKVKVVVP